MYTITITLNTEAKLSDLLALLDAIEANNGAESYDIDLQGPTPVVGHSHRERLDLDRIVAAVAEGPTPQPPHDHPIHWPTDVELDVSRRANERLVRTSALNESRQARSYAKVLAVECPSCHAGEGQACKTSRGLYAIYPHMPRQRAARKGSKR